MRVNVAVCGIFHFRPYIGELARLGVLENFYYSHKRSTDGNALGIPNDRAHNLWLKEYLLRALDKAWPFGSTEPVHHVFHDLWERQLIAQWRDCDLFHVMLHGTARKALRMCQEKGIVTLGEPVMTHPRKLQFLLEQEHDFLGLPKPPAMRKQFVRLLDEVAASDILLCGSRFLRDSFVAEGFAADRAIALSYGADVSRFYPPTDVERGKGEDGKFRVICIGQITPRKGQHYLLEAWKRLGLKSTEAELVIVGLIKDDMKPILAKYEGLFTYKSPMPYQPLRLEYGR